jgi:hypothetical protein
VDGLDDDNRFFRTGRFARRDRLSIGLLFGASFSNAIVRQSVEITAGARAHGTNSGGLSATLSIASSLSFFVVDDFEILENYVALFFAHLSSPLRFGGKRKTEGRSVK